ncbi:Oxoglutarate and iron-dependent oxygenase degradation C-term-domain-containing protein [Halteromyces radiatus]|uniref:Oxoglutarate and iron-dependent oxygenase degradation C-term-domain-containing protein n=1 Tax=Halteromyces radiatus TaxID=101107 RepID=UPI0022207C29|nr:Oxoglutarate and iron-dependent oxygenase degradation C-term-domain-containing protein [Halteromyces radiatus]KAI8076749.1 Oxoglutarate and iron-dependent oxygenase degradation C-term-domain-containing protein [Halteromyces radiatus]
MSTQQENEEERSFKRSRLQSQKENFHPGLLEETTIEKIHKAFQTSQPYLHCKIDQLMNDSLLRSVRKEIQENLHFTVKETDIYKVWQTGDLANLDGLPEDELAKLSHLFKLRNALYSQDFRDFISSVTNCGPLSGTKTDMSINSYNEGCHLLNHDDVIGTRRVSFILYLTDPDQRWDPQDGGALELYPVIEKGIPAVEPTVIIPPQWNQFVMFTVQPGHSFHSVEEVVPQGKPRLSISGWFHIPQKGEPGYNALVEEGQAKSSLEQLQEESDSSTKFAQYKTPLEDDATEGLTEEDLISLAEWMNPHYLNMTILSKMSEQFLEESAVQCKDILNKEWYDKIKQATLEADEQDGFGKERMMAHGTGTQRGNWECQGPPHRHRYMVVNSDNKKQQESSSSLLGDLKHKFSDEPFRHWLAVVTQLLPLGYRGDARRFRPGHDYTLATTNTRGQGVLDVTFCMASMPSDEAQEKWDGGEYGGYECYMAPHDEEEDAAVYKAADEEGALLTMPAGENELALVLRDEGVMRFIKYVSARAPGSRWDVAFEYDLPEEQDEEEQKE